MRIGAGTTTDTGIIDVKIRTVSLAIDCQAVPLTGTRSEGAPNYEVLREGFEIGAGWDAISKRDKNYISLKLDGPEQPKPIFFTLWPLRGKPGEYDVIFSREEK